MDIFGIRNSEPKIQQGRSITQRLCGFPGLKNSCNVNNTIYVLKTHNKNTKNTTTLDIWNIVNILQSEKLLGNTNATN